MSGWLTVFLKEVSENLRDKRTLANALILGPMIGPVMFALMINFITAKQVEESEKTLKLAVVGREYAPNLVNFLKQQGVEILAGAQHSEERIRNEEEQIALSIPFDFAQAWNEGQPARVDVFYDGSRQRSSAAMQRLRALLEAYSRQIGVLRLQVRGVSPQLTAALAVNGTDLSTAQSRGAMMLAALPYLLIISAFMGGMYLAIDTTAGERERQSLEPLLICPVPREQIMFGKLCATAAFALASVLICVLTFATSVRFMPVDVLGFELNLSFAPALKIFLLMFPVVLFAASMQTIVAAYAKTFREAQTYLQFLVIVPVVPSLVMVFNPIKPVTWMMATPILGQSILINQIVRGDIILAMDVMWSAAGTLLVAVVCAWTAVRLYRRESIALAG